MRYVHVIRDKIALATWWQKVLTIAIVAVIYIYCAGWLGATLLPPLRGWGTGVPSLPDIAPNNVPWLFVRWDSGYYWDIATAGYLQDGDERAFFPLYPFAIRALNTTLGIPILWSGLLVSIFSFLGAGLMIYKWVSIDYGHEHAMLATLSIYSFPISFYFVAFYAEPLFLLLGILSFYFARKGQFSASGMAIALAGVTRPHGIFLAIPYVIEFLQQQDFSRARWLRFIFGILVAPTGLLAYSIFLTQLGSGNLYEPYLNLLQKQWYTYVTWPWVTLSDGLNAAIFSTNIQQDWFSRAYVIHDTIYAILGLTLSLWGFRHLRFSVAAYLFISIIFFFTVHGPYGYAFDSMPRRFASLSPVYLAIALFLNRLPAKLRWIAISLFVLQLGILAAWFASGRWVS